ncbi:MAG TPA: TRAP transporter small permease [Beutenbergiaceae bacterium]|nr:TRAP transporter small permease [Beutenbergiaceae bacterium]
MSPAIRSRAARVNQYLLKTEEWFGVLLIVGFFVLLLIQVAMRYLMGSTYPWIVEVARLLFIWTTLIGAGFAVGRKSHITVTAISDALLKRRSHIATALGLLISLALGVLLAVASWELMETLGGVAASASGLSRGLFFLPGVIGFGLVALHSALLLLSGEYRESSADEGMAA